MLESRNLSLVSVQQVYRPDSSKR